MKFKKTSVIGVILSLALVLAVTAAFASEPKTPADTVEYHGQTYNRADLSQETLDWLDWYLALPEEEQLAISMVPPELIPGLAPDGYDDSVDVNASVTLGYKTLTGDAAKYASQLYAGMTRDKVHQLLGEPHSMLSGLYGDIYNLNKLGDPLAESTVDDPIFIIYYDYEDFNSGVSKVERVVYRTGDGEHIELIRSAPEDQPNYVNPGENAYDNYNSVKAGESGAIDPSLKEALETALRDRIQATIQDVLDKSQTVDNYDVKLPSFNEDGGSVAADGGIVGSTFYSLCCDEDCGVTGSHVHINGQVVMVDYQNPYEDSSPVPSYIPDPRISSLGSAAPSISCGVEGCTETRYHAHNEGRTILLNDPCPVEGCTITGNHIHGDVCYSCNGAGHSGGHCDGSCYTYTTLPEYPTSGTHHSDGHHENDHH